MTYPKKLTTQAELVLAPFLPRVKKLKDGESLVLEDTAENIATLRYYLYTWLHLNSLKEIYVLRKESLTQMRILRRSIPTPKIVSVESLSSVEEFVMNNLLDTETPIEASDIITTAIANGKLSPDHLEDAMSEWRRINGL